MAQRSSVAPIIEEAWAGLRFVLALPGFLRRPLRADEARAVIRVRLERRATNLLDTAHRAIHDNPANPYRWLFKQAGCEFGDLENLVARDGVEGALNKLLRSGIYLTVDEFKGKQPIVRGSATLQIDPSLLRNRAPKIYSSMQSSGTSGATATPIPLTLEYAHDRAANTGAMLEARGGTTWRQAMWGVPGGGAISYLLQLAGAGLRPARWFSQIDIAAHKLHPRYRWSARAMRWASLAAGAPMPAPEYVPLEDPLPIARWMREELERGHVPHLFTFSSCAVRVCQAALDNGLRLDGAQFTTSGEALTPARRAAIEATGAQVAACYGIAECGWIGPGCLQPEISDDLHLYEDLHALIQPGPEGATPDLPGNALLVSSLSASAGVILINVCFGDQADVSERGCGCPMAAMGWRRHLQRVRSYEKLTAGGMTFLDTEVITILEEILPKKFGGGPTDYQLVEEETENGGARLRLLVHPDVGPLDAEAVKETFFAGIAAGSGAAQIMQLQWREGQLLRVERAAPRNTERGKILHLYRERAATS